MATILRASSSDELLSPSFRRDSAKGILREDYQPLNMEWQAFTNVKNPRPVTTGLEKMEDFFTRTGRLMEEFNRGAIFTRLNGMEDYKKEIGVGYRTKFQGPHNPLKDWQACIKDYIAFTDKVGEKVGHFTEILMKIGSLGLVYAPGLRQGAAAINFLIRMTVQLALIAAVAIPIILVGIVVGSIIGTIYLLKKLGELAIYLCKGTAHLLQHGCGRVMASIESGRFYCARDTESRFGGAADTIHALRGVDGVDQEAVWETNKSDLKQNALIGEEYSHAAYHFARGQYITVGFKHTDGEADMLLNRLHQKKPRDRITVVEFSEERKAYAEAVRFAAKHGVTREEVFELIQDQDKLPSELKGQLVVATTSTSPLHGREEEIEVSPTSDAPVRKKRVEPQNQLEAIILRKSEEKVPDVPASKHWFWRTTDNVDYEVVNEEE